MAHSRLEKIGTIYSRINGLIKSGAMKLEDRPLWYEVYQAFPPLLPPRFDRVASDVPIRQIFYPEDKIRAVMHKKCSEEMPAVDLTSSEASVTQRVITECEAMQGLNIEQAVDTLCQDLRSQGVLQARKTGRAARSDKSDRSDRPNKSDRPDRPEVPDTATPASPSKPVDIKNIFDSS